MSDSPVLQRSPLHDEHLALGGRLVPFSGWEMPVQFTSIMDEHLAVRQKVGIFDISHMGQLRLDGSGGLEWLNGMLTNNTSLLSDGGGQYTLMLNEQGGVIDDLIIYRVSENSVFLVVNASMIAEDVAWLEKNLPKGLKLVNLSEQTAGFAVQGPESTAAFAQVMGSMLILPPRNGIVAAMSDSGPVVVCRTGYTGEDGFEFFCDKVHAVYWYRKFVGAIQSLGGRVCGLGARDSLRLEAGFPLNGQDLSPERTPLQAGLGYFVDLSKPFIGRDVLLAEKAAGLSQKLAAFKMTEKSPPPRHDYPVLADGEVVGKVASGGLEPSLGEGIGMAYLPAPLAKVGQAIAIDIRGRKFAAQVVKKPFLPKKP